MSTTLNNLLPTIAHEILAAPTGAVTERVTAALESVGRALDVPWLKLNVYIEARSVRPLCEWLAPEHADHFRPPGVDPTPLSAMPWFRSQLLSLAPIHHRVDSLPPEAAGERNRMELQGVAWIVVLPTADAGGLRAGLVLRDHRDRPLLDDETLRILSLVADILVGAMLRERAQEDLARSERRFRTLAEATTEAICVHADGHVLDVNDRACALFGRSRVQMIGLSVVHDLVPRDRAEQVRASITESRTETYETEIVTALGERIPVQVNSRHFDVDGRKFRIAALRDLRGRIAALERQEEAALRMRNLIEATFEGYVVSRVGLVLEANEGFAKMCGYEPEELVGMSAADVTTPEGAATVRENIINEVHTPYVVTGVRKDGSTFPMLIQGTETYYQGERVRITGFRDVTKEQERDQLEERIRQGQKMESLGMLAGGIAHDFNNLLVGVLGNADLALDLLPEGTEERELVEQMRLASVRAAELVRQMLAYAGRGDLTKEPVEITSLVREMSDLLHASTAARTTATFDLPPRLPRVLGDATQLRQVVMNVYTNATEAAAEQGGHVEVSASVTRLTTPPPDLVTPLTVTGGEYICLRFEDDGPGIAPEARARMFDPFFSTKFAGRGLGLAAVLGILERHGGGMAVQTTLGAGTCVCVYLPIIEEAELMADGDDSLEPEPPSTPPPRWTVLIVDDDDGVRMVATAALTRVGHTVITATNGTDGLIEFEQHEQRLDAVLLDVTMPGLPTEELFAVIRKARPELPVLFSSGYLDGALDASVRAEPKVEFLQKPWRVAALVEALQGLIEE